MYIWLSYINIYVCTYIYIDIYFGRNSALPGNLILWGEHGAICWGHFLICWTGRHMALWELAYNYKIKNKKKERHIPRQKQNWSFTTNEGMWLRWRSLISNTQRFIGKREKKTRPILYFLKSKRLFFVLKLKIDFLNHFWVYISCLILLLWTDTAEMPFIWCSSFTLFHLKNSKCKTTLTKVHFISSLRLNIWNDKRILTHSNEMKYINFMGYTFTVV